MAIDFDPEEFVFNHDPTGRNKVNDYNLGKEEAKLARKSVGYNDFIGGIKLLLSFERSEITAIEYSRILAESRGSIKDPYYHLDDICLFYDNAKNEMFEEISSMLENHEGLNTN